MILSQSAVTCDVRPPRVVEEAGRSRSRLLRDRFSTEEIEAMVGLYRAGTPLRLWWPSDTGSACEASSVYYRLAAYAVETLPGKRRPIRRAPGACLFEPL